MGYFVILLLCILGIHCKHIVWQHVDVVVVVVVEVVVVVVAVVVPVNRVMGVGYIVVISFG